MSDQLFLNGRVRKTTLPVFTAAPDANAPRSKRLLLPQGELAQFTDGSELLRYVAAIELRPGGTRGNHYHLRKHESLYVFSGAITLFVADPESGEKAELDLAPGDLVVIPPGIAHALQVQRPGMAIEFSPEAFDPQDTYRCVVA